MRPFRVFLAVLLTLGSPGASARAAAVRALAPAAGLVIPGFSLGSGLVSGRAGSRLPRLALPGFSGLAGGALSINPLTPASPEPLRASPAAPVPAALPLRLAPAAVPSGTSRPVRAIAPPLSPRGAASLAVRLSALRRARGLDALDLVFDNAGADSGGSGTPTRVLVGPASFSVGDLADLVGTEFQERVRAIPDPAERRELISAHTPIDAFDIRWVLEQDERSDPRGFKGKSGAEFKKSYDRFLKKVAAFETKLPGILQAHFKSVLRNFPHEIRRGGDYAVYTIGRGLEFWDALAKSDDPEKSLAGRVMLRAYGRREGGDLAVRILVGLEADLEYRTQILDASRMTAAELGVVRDRARAGGLKASRHGGRILVGGGAGFFLARRILRAAGRLADPVLAARFSRVIRHFASRGIAIVHDEHQGAAAYYDPSEDEMAFVMPSRADLNTTAHEGNHARFQRFQSRLKTWSGAKGLAIPYEIDGPQYALFGTPFGSFMNLLNELNSWRIGESFDGGWSDARILGMLRRSYGRQAGWESVRVFSRIWTAKRTAGKSVPRLIREAVLSMNRIPDARVAGLAREALAGKDRVKAHDFMRLVRARAPEAATMPAGWKAGLESLLAFPDDGVAEIAGRLLGRPEEDQDGPEAGEASGEPGRRDLVRIVKEAMTEDTPKSGGRGKKALARLEALLDQWGLETIHTPRALESINAIDGGTAEEAGREFEKTANRPARPGHKFFSPGVDRALARGLFDGRRGVHRLDLVNLIRTRTYPEELPRLHARVREIITAGDADPNDLWLARMFLVPGNEFFSAHLAWGESVAAAVRGDATPSAEALEFAAEYYRLALGRALPGSRWGKFAHPMDAAMSREVRKGLREMTPEERVRWRAARDHLWKLLVHPEERVRLAARFAIAAYPGYLMGLESRILRTLKARSSKYRGQVVRLAAMTEEGFLPAVDAALKEDFSPTSEEAEILTAPRLVGNFYHALARGGIARLEDDPVVAKLREAGTQVWALRHGQTESNRAGRFSGGGTDSALTGEPDASGLSGVGQADLGAVKLFESLGGDDWALRVMAGEAPPLVLARGTLRRSAQTAARLAAFLDRRIGALAAAAGRAAGPPLYETAVFPDLNEIRYGTWEDIPLDEARKRPLWRTWSAADEGRDFLTRFPGGESRFDVMLRQRVVFGEVVRRFAGRTVVLVSHYETIIAQKALAGLLPSDPGDGALKAEPVPNAEPLRLIP